MQRPIVAAVPPIKHDKHARGPVKTDLHVQGQPHLLGVLVDVRPVETNAALPDGSLCTVFVREEHAGAASALALKKNLRAYNFFQAGPRVRRGTDVFWEGVALGIKIVRPVRSSLQMADWVRVNGHHPC